MEWARVAAVGLVSYILYYCLWGDQAEILRAIKIVYYILNVVENVTTQHFLGVTK